MGTRASQGIVMFVNICIYIGSGHQSSLICRTLCKRYLQMDDIQRLHNNIILIHCTLYGK